MLLWTPQTKLKAIPNAADRAMGLLVSRPTNTGENQLRTNLKPRISSNAAFTTKKTRICTRRLFFCSNLSELHRNDLTDKQRILLSVKDFANHAKFVFSWPAWDVCGFEIATKGSQPYGREPIHYHGPHILRNVAGGSQKWLILS